MARGGGVRGTRLYQAFERGLLSVGMRVVAFFIERRLLKAIRTGGMKRAPRTLAESGDFVEKEAGELREGSLSSAYQRRSA